jgi:hypothetical protein
MRCPVLGRCVFVFKGIPKKEQLKYKKHNEQFYQDDQPKGFSPFGHLPKPVGV